MQCWIYLIYLVTIAALAGLPIFSSSGESMVEVCDLTPQLGFDEDINFKQNISVKHITLNDVDCLYYFILKLF